MSEFVAPDCSFLPEEELVEIEALFERFVAALESEDEDSMLRFFAEEEPFFDGASEAQNSIFMLKMLGLGLISEEEMAAVLMGDDLDAGFLEIDFVEFTLDDEYDPDDNYDPDPDADR